MHIFIFSHFLDKMTRPSTSTVVTLHQNGIESFKKKDFNDALMNFQLMLVSNLTLSSCESNTKLKPSLSQRRTNHVSREKLTKDLMALKLNNTLTNNIPQSHAIHAKYDKGCFDKLTETIDIDECSPEDTPTILYNLGKTQENLRNYQDALGSYFDAISGAEKIFACDPDNCFLLVSILRSIGQIYYLHGNFVDSLSAYSIAHYVNMEGFKFKYTENPVLASILCCISVLKYHVSCANDCALDVNSLEDSLEIMKFLLDDDHADIATAVNNLGRCYFKQRKYDDALSSFKEALRIRNKVYSTTHPDVAATFYNLGEVTFRTVDITNSSKFYSEYLRIARISDMWYYPDVAKALHKVGDIARIKKNNSLMFTSFKDALQIELRLYGSINTQVVETLNKLGTSYIEVVDYKSAKIVYEQVLRIQMELNGSKYNPNVLSTLINIAQVCKQLEDYEESLIAYQQVLHIQKDTMQNTTITDMFETLTNLGSLYHQNGNLRQAYQVYDEALQLKDEGTNDIGVIQIEGILIQIFSILMELEEFEVAETYELQLLQIRKSSSEQDQRFLYQHLCYIASTYRDYNFYEIALIYYEQAYEIKFKIRGFWDRDRAIVLSDIGEMNFMLGNFEAALEKFKQALIILRRRNEVKDMFAANLMRDIGNSYLGTGDDESSMEMLIEASSVYIKAGLTDADIAILTRGLDNAIDDSGPAAAAAA